MSNKRRMRHLVSFRVNASENINEENWQELFTAYCSIAALKQDSVAFLENHNFGQIITKNHFLFKLRYSKHITKQMRIFFRERQFEIINIVDATGDGRFLSIIALELGC